MDLVSKRYAGPFLLMDQMIAAGDFGDWAAFIVKKATSEAEDQKMWELFLHRDMEAESFNDFKARMQQSSSAEQGAMDEATKQKIINDSQNILNGFMPEGGGEK